MARTMTADQIADAVHRRALAAKRAGLQAGVAMLKRVVLEELTRGSRDANGREYRRGGRKNKAGRRVGGKTHRASTRGNPPARDTGRLINSIQARVRADEGEVGTNVRYARPLEEALDRPFLKKVAEREDDRVKKAMELAITRALSAGGGP